VKRFSKEWDNIIVCRVEKGRKVERLIADIVGRLKRLNGKNMSHIGTVCQCVSRLARPDGVMQTLITAFS